MFQTTLIELEHGEIEQDIDESLKMCEILILLLSNIYSSWTEKEFSTAWKSGIPVRVFKMKNTHGIRRTEFERQQRFFKSILGRGIRIFGYDHPYSPHSTKLLQDIDTDLAILTQQMTHDYVKVRRIIKR
jgi:hypothetical protein